MSAKAEEQELLGQLVLDPSLLDSCGTDQLNGALFSTPEHRKVFASINKIWADLQPDTIDPSILSQECGLPRAFIEKLTEGNYRPDPVNFSWRVARQAQRRSGERLLKVCSDEMRTFEKTGEFELANLEVMRAVFDEVLNNCNGNGTKAREELSIPLSSIAPETVDWVWPNYLPANKLVLISGDPGCGKTWFCLDLAARLSTGQTWPDSSRGRGPSNVLILSCEDGAADTFRPRLDSLGADPGRIFLVQEPIDLSEGMGLKKFAREVERRQPGMIIVDPIFDFSGVVNPNATERVRAMITPIAGIAEKARAVLIFTSHLNKASTMQALYRTTGSASGWIGKARAAFLIFEDDDDEAYPKNRRRIFFPVKSNLAPEKPDGWAYRITGHGLHYEPLSADFNIEEHLASDRHETAPELDAAKALLREALKDGPVEAKQLQEQAHLEGISVRTLQRAKKSLGVKSEKSTFSGKWAWSMG